MDNNTNINIITKKIVINCYAHQTSFPHTSLVFIESYRTLYKYTRHFCKSYLISAIVTCMIAQLPQTSWNQTFLEFI